jgi:hypothetical protein
MPKSSIEYEELYGLKTALSNLKCREIPNKEIIVQWLKDRIEELEKR